MCARYDETGHQKLLRCRQRHGATTAELAAFKLPTRLTWCLPHQTISPTTGQMNTNGWNTSPDVMNVKSKKNCFLVLLAGGGELITAAVYVLWSKINGQAKSGFGPVSYSNLMRAIKINITCLSNKEVAQTVLGLGFLFSQTFSGFEGGENGWFFKGCLNMIDTLHPARNSSDLSSVLNLCRPPAPLQEWPQWIRRKKKKKKNMHPLPQYPPLSLSLLAPVH